jgi:serine/threonine protein kinase
MQTTSDFEPHPDPAEGHDPVQIGRYQLLERLASGGMGTVYKARDPQLNRVVAIKVPQFEGPPQAVGARRQRFQREARAAAQVWHPHVCPIYDVGEHDEVPYVVMAYVEGQSLTRRLAEGGRYENVGEAVALIRQVLDALEAVHAHRIVHRDIKPGNILIDPTGRAVLTDFGLARPEADQAHLTSDGVVVGTPAYMAPEQAGGPADRIGPWTDLYSVGIVFFEMLTGQLPFQGPPMAVLGKILHEPPATLSRLRPYLDARLDAILLKALHKEPEQRFRSAREFSEALAGLTVAAPTASMPAQMENQATPNHSPSERNAHETSDAQIVAGIFGVLATSLGMGVLAYGIAQAAMFRDLGSSGEIGFSAGVMVIGILTLAWSFWSWPQRQKRGP